MSFDYQALAPDEDVEDIRKANALLNELDLQGIVYGMKGAEAGAIKIIIRYLKAERRWSRFG